MSDLSRDLEFTPGVKYVYYCANETVHGLEIAEPPQIPEGSLLVSDMSSNILSRTVDISKVQTFVVRALTQVCSDICWRSEEHRLQRSHHRHWSASYEWWLLTTLVRTDLLGKALPSCPEMLDFAIHARNGSLYNTPPTWR
jgi:phosphoserine aminotransferase